MTATPFATVDWLHGSACLTIAGQGAGTAVSLFGCRNDVSALIKRVMGRHPGTSIGEPRYESDTASWACTAGPPWP